MQCSGECIMGCSLILCNSLGQGQTSFSLDFLLAVQGTPSCSTQFPQTNQNGSWWGYLQLLDHVGVYMDAACSVWQQCIHT